MCVSCSFGKIRLLRDGLSRPSLFIRPHLLCHNNYRHVLRTKHKKIKKQNNKKKSEHIYYDTKWEKMFSRKLFQPVSLFFLPITIIYFYFIDLLRYFWFISFTFYSFFPVRFLMSKRVERAEYRSFPSKVGSFPNCCLDYSSVVCRISLMFSRSIRGSVGVGGDSWKRGRRCCVNSSIFFLASFFLPFTRRKVFEDEMFLLFLFFISIIFVERHSEKASESSAK